MHEDSPTCRRQACKDQYCMDQNMRTFRKSTPKSTKNDCDQAVSKVLCIPTGPGHGIRRLQQTLSVLAEPEC